MNNKKKLSPRGILEQQRHVVEEYLRAFLATDKDAHAFYHSEVPINALKMSDLVRCLIDATKHEELEMRTIAAFTLIQLGNIHTEALNVFEDGLASTQFMRRFEAASFLSSCDRVPRPLIPSLVRVMEKDEWCCRVTAAAALMGAVTDLDDENDVPVSQAVPLLWRALRGDESAITPEDMIRIAADCGFFGEVDRSKLLDARNQFIVLIRDLAACALGRHRVHARHAVSVLIENLKSKDEFFLLKNVFLLLRVGREAEAAVPALIKLLQLPMARADLRTAIANVIGKLGKGKVVAEALVKQLDRSVRSGGWPTACTIVEGLVAMGESPKAAIEAMIKLLSHPDPAARSMAVLSLGKFKASAADAIPVLIDHLKTEPDRSVWRTAIDTIVAIGEPAIPALVEVIEQGDFRVFPLASEALTRLMGDTPDRLAHLLLTHPSGQVKLHAAALLKLFGPLAAPAVPIATQLLRVGDDDTRYAALMALAGIGPDAREALPDLIRVFLAPNPEFSEWSKAALLRIGPDAVAALTRALPDATAAEQARIMGLLDRLGDSGIGRTAGPDYGWIGDDSLVEFFVLIGSILEARGVVSKRQLVREIGQLQSLGKVPKEYPYKENLLRAWLDKLEEKLESRAGRSIRLIGSKSTRPGTLTEDGIHYLQEFRLYLKAFHNKIVDIF